MAKYRMLREELASCGRFAADDFREAPCASIDALGLAHATDYIQRVCTGKLSEAEVRRIGFPWTAAMVERSRRSAGATIAACQSALTEGCAANLAGGTHHAHRDFGSGFCVFNDAAIAARVVLQENHVRRVVIIDCDVHQGDGTAAIFAADPSVFTFSIHGQKNFPFRKQTSDLDVELPDGCADAAYLDALERSIEIVFDQSQPDLVIYLAGADPFEGDRLGRLSLSMGGLLARDKLVLEACKRAQVPVAIAMAGGYAHEIADTVAIHAATIRLAHDLNRT